MAPMINKIWIKPNICIFAFTLWKYCFVVYSINSKQIENQDKTNFGSFSIEAYKNDDEWFDFNIG